MRSQPSQGGGRRDAISMDRPTGYGGRPAATITTSILEQSNARVFFITFPVFVRFVLGPVFLIAPDAERVAEFFWQRRLAEQAGVFEPGEVGEIAQARQSPQGQEGRSASSHRCEARPAAGCAARWRSVRRFAARRSRRG
jgi:hypothetical protein